MSRGIKLRLPMSVVTVGAAVPRMVRDAVSTAIENLGETLFHISPKRREKLQERKKEHPQIEGRWFTADEGKLVDVLASLIVPSGETAPGTSDIDVLGPSALQQIDGWVASHSAKQALYARGLIALDEMAYKAGGARFVGLPPRKQTELLRVVEALHREQLDPSATSPVKKIRRKLRHLYGMWQGWSAAVRLFPIIVSDTFKAFYTSEVAWIWLGYDGPPMPLGYEKLTTARPPKRAPPLTAARPSSPRRLADRAQSADVVIVGCGAGGAVAAKELSEAGLSVVVLEAGRRYEPLVDYLTERTDFELRAKATFDPADELRDLYTTGGSKGFSYNRVKGVGGSTLAYAAMSPRLHESDFRVRSEDGIADDWPISYADVEPYYTRVEYELGVSGPDGANPFEPPRSRPYPTPPHAFNLASTAVKRGADKLGLHMVREPLALPSRDWQGRPACVGAGTCHLGCLISAKSSMDVTYARKAAATGRGDIRTECMASEVEVDGAGKARAVVYFDKDGHHQRVAARAIVLAGNAIETPRLLLMSTSNRFPNGAANSSGLVGLNFMEHLAVFAFGLFDERIDPWRGTPTGGMLQDHYATRSSNNFARGWTTLVSSNSHWPLAVAGRIPGWGDEHKRTMLERFGHYACVTTIGEQLPDRRNRIVLDPFRKDLYGLPAPRLLNEARENDLAMISAISAEIKTLLEAAGARNVWGNEYSPGMSSHYMGTCRMGNDPGTSVVNAWGRTHDVPNLFIADGSVFVTGGAVNPALTISALALRTSVAIVSAFRKGEI
ncbi:MAG: GMC oxidoreductase [Gammaproteobacteria bacterium]|nr:GMC oxidoreductase [Gammaproteobacteria bacterium]MDH3411290.1 GMC oxidoreductase [Gammaproteobacteria bacterium]